MDTFHGQFSRTIFTDIFQEYFSFMDTFFTHPQLKTTVSTCKRRRSVVCKALIAWIMTHKLLLPSLPRSLQSCQSRYTHGILILVKEYIFLLAEKLMPVRQKLSFLFPITISAKLSKYTHGVLILVKDYMFLLSEKLMPGAEILSFPFPSMITAKLSK